MKSAVMGPVALLDGFRRKIRSRLHTAQKTGYITPDEFGVLYGMSLDAIDGLGAVAGTFAENLARLRSLPSRGIRP